MPEITPPQVNQVNTVTLTPEVEKRDKEHNEEKLTEREQVKTDGDQILSRQLAQDSRQSAEAAKQKAQESHQAGDKFVRQEKYTQVKESQESSRSQPPVRSKSDSPPTNNGKLSQQRDTSSHTDKNLLEVSQPHGTADTQGKFATVLQGKSYTAQQGNLPAPPAKPGAPLLSQQQPSAAAKNANPSNPNAGLVSRDIPSPKPAVSNAPQTFQKGDPLKKASGTSVLPETPETPDIPDGKVTLLNSDDPAHESFLTLSYQGMNLWKPQPKRPPKEKGETKSPESSDGKKAGAPQGGKPATPVTPQKESANSSEEEIELLASSGDEPTEDSSSPKGMRKTKLAGFYRDPETLRG